MTKLSLQRFLEKSKIKIGDKFGRLEVKELAERKYPGTSWLCECDCGNIKIVAGGHLRDGHTKSCGCLKRETKLTHGMSNTPTYESWEAMIQRCNNPKIPCYKYYGGRGIAVCESWLKFENFFEDLGLKPKGLTLERIDNELGYFQENCCWDSPTAQNRNRRLNKNNKTGMAGIFWDKIREKYQVAIKVNYKNHFLGRFDTMEDAITARLNGKQKYWRHDVHELSPSQ